MNNYQRLFGTGPRGTFYSLVLLSVAVTLRDAAGLPAVTSSDPARYLVLGIATCATLVMVAWSIHSLPVQDRGRKLATSGAFRYFRHPLYAAFVSCFNFGFAVTLNNWIYILWAIVMIPVWQLNVLREERMMLARFGDAWTDYCSRTWRFFPRLPIRYPARNQT